MQVVSEQQSSPPRRRSHVSRQTIILICGLTAIIASLLLRNSRWAEERRLKHLSAEDLALAVHDSPNDALALVYYGGALLADGKLPESERTFARAIKLEPDNERATLGLATSQFRQGRLPEALDNYQKAIKLNPTDTEAYLGLSETYQQQGYEMHATEPLKKIVQLDPKRSQAWYSLGKLYGDVGQSDLAMDAMQHAVNLAPTQAVYWRDLAQLSRHYSKLDDAESQLTKALKLAPNDPVAYLWLGQVYLQMGDTPQLRNQAKQCFESAISHDPQSQESYFGLGQLYERSGNYALAAERFKKACDLDPSDDQALHYLGECTVHLGHPADGAKLLAAAQELEAAKRDIGDLRKRMLGEPDARDLHLRLARTLRKYQDDAEALKQYAAYQNLGARGSGSA